ncbi:sensor domain-containing diguanylate cyclase [Shewanella corallii]|uniref:diguanylate cyclase n=1 Tax=Shewanella corallii TaxID=560080 RepID=A0ABT0N7Y4_9GAMM|nr:sensor domain-containing diguanylate cyclase [Shewanella corallii]MCL2914553.1 sensor domain-containing diguanylate cyclase [Shewanella corallii]
MPNQMNELHRLIEMVQTIEVGLVMLDKDYRVQLWNGFMENHSGISPNTLRDRNLFECFPELHEEWLTKKMEVVLTLQNRAFISWEQRPYIFRFKNFRPITGQAEFMYQNVTLFSLSSLTGEVTHICMIIYDVTDVAVNKLQLKEANAELAELSQIDGLTKLYNRRHWQDLLNREFERYQRYHEHASLVMLDIDFFKSINDNYGHVVGDRAIQHLARLIQDSLRETDVAGRYGGEEFGIVLPNTDAASASQFAERLRQKVERSPLKAEGQNIKFTISAGICMLDNEIAQNSDWIRRADAALYRAKETGRNNVQVYSKDEDS